MALSLYGVDVRGQRSSQAITVTRSGAQPFRQGPVWNFTTSSSHRSPVQRQRAVAQVSGGRVTFEAGARSAWRAHPMGQMLIVTAGAGGCKCGADQFRKSGRG